MEEIALDPMHAITVQQVEQAKEILIQRQDTHIDSLASILRGVRVRAIIEPMLAGQALGAVPNDDRQWRSDAMHGAEREGRPDPLKAGLEQIDRYLAGLSLETGWLVIFDQHLGLSPISDTLKEWPCPRTTTEPAETATGRLVIVIRG